MSKRGCTYCAHNAQTNHIATINTHRKHMHHTHALLEAASATLESAAIVGVVEHYKESLCVARIFIAQPPNKISAFLGCMSNTANTKIHRNTMTTANMFLVDGLARKDIRMATALDRALYEVAKSLLSKKVVEYGGQSLYRR